MFRRPWRVLGVLALAGFFLPGARPVLAGGGKFPVYSSARGGGFARAASYGGYGGYGGYYSPVYFGPLLSPAGSYLPPDWWAGQNAGTDPRQDGYNPSAGYPWNTVGALLLSTTPVNARVTLDGTYVGTANYLGPFQLPMGEHTLKIEAAGYEASEITLKVEKPSVQQLHVVLGPARQAAIVVPKQ